MVLRERRPRAGRRGFLLSLYSGCYGDTRLVFTLPGSDIHCNRYQLAKSGGLMNVATVRALTNTLDRTDKVSIRSDFYKATNEKPNRRWISKSQAVSVIVCKRRCAHSETIDHNNLGIAPSTYYAFPPHRLGGSPRRVSDRDPDPGAGRCKAGFWDFFHIREWDLHRRLSLPRLAGSPSPE